MVCIWNLLPVISEQYEKKGVKKKNAQEGGRVSDNADQEMKNLDANTNSNADNEDDDQSVKYKRLTNNCIVFL